MLAVRPIAGFAALWPMLRQPQYLLHRTSPEGLLRIMRGGAILPNDDEQFPASYPQSASSYGRALGAISLFDFGSEDEARIEEHRFKWEIVLIPPQQPMLLIRIAHQALDQPALLLPRPPQRR